MSGQALVTRAEAAKWKPIIKLPDSTSLQAEELRKLREKDLCDEDCLRCKLETKREGPLFFIEHCFPRLEDGIESALQKLKKIGVDSNANPPWKELLKSRIRCLHGQAMIQWRRQHNDDDPANLYAQLVKLVKFANQISDTLTSICQGKWGPKTTMDNWNDRVQPKIIEFNGLVDSWAAETHEVELSDIMSKFEHIFYWDISKQPRRDKVLGCLDARQENPWIWPKENPGLIIILLGEMKYFLRFVSKMREADKVTPDEDLDDHLYAVCNTISKISEIIRETWLNSTRGVEEDQVKRAPFESEMKRIFSQFDLTTMNVMDSVYQCSKKCSELIRCRIQKTRAAESSRKKTRMPTKLSKLSNSESSSVAYKMFEDTPELLPPPTVYDDLDRLLEQLRDIQQAHQSFLDLSKSQRNSAGFDYIKPKSIRQENESFRDLQDEIETFRTEKKRTACYRQAEAAYLTALITRHVNRLFDPDRDFHEYLKISENIRRKIDHWLDVTPQTKNPALDEDARGVYVEPKGIPDSGLGSADGFPNGSRSRRQTGKKHEIRKGNRDRDGAHGSESDTDVRHKAKPPGGNITRDQYDQGPKPGTKKASHQRQWVDRDQADGRILTDPSAARPAARPPARRQSLGHNPPDVLEGARSAAQPHGMRRGSVSITDHAGHQLFGSGTAGSSTDRSNQHSGLVERLNRPIRQQGYSGFQAPQPQVPPHGAYFLEQQWQQTQPQPSSRHYPPQVEFRRVSTYNAYNVGGQQPGPAPDGYFPIAARPVRRNSMSSSRPRRDSVNYG